MPTTRTHVPRKKKRTNIARLSNEPDMISLEHFPTWRGVVLNKKMYDAMEILKGLRNHPNAFRTVPHSRRPLTPANVQAAMAVLGRVPKNPNAMTYNEFWSRRANKRFRKSEKHQRTVDSPQYVSYKHQLTRLNTALGAALALYTRPGTPRAVGYDELVDLTDTIRNAITSSKSNKGLALYKVLLSPLAFEYIPRSFVRGPTSTRMDKPIIQELGRLRLVIAAALRAQAANPFYVGSPSELENAIASIRAATTPASVEREVFGKLLYQSRRDRTPSPPRRHPNVHPPRLQRQIGFRYANSPNSSRASTPRVIGGPGIPNRH